MTSTHFFWTAGSLALALGLVISPTTARANVYATDIQINGILTNTSSSVGSPVSITYHLNENATTGVTVNILRGSTPVTAITGGTSMGLNTVSWTPGVAGNYSVTITAASTGFSAWTQTSLDSNPGNVAGFPHGMAVDNNPGSPYYGRVFVNNGLDTTTYGVSQLIGIYKYNADATPADEGGFGYGNYTVNNSGQTGSGEMAQHGTGGHGQEKMRVGTDDMVYMCDYSNDGSVVAFDPEISTNQMVIDQGSSSGNDPNAPNYSGNPHFGNLSNGIDCFDVTPTGTNAAVWLCDNDYPNGWGVWMYHMTGGTADPADTVGAQAVVANGGNSTISLIISSGGCMIDTNLDIFVSADQINTGAAPARTMVFSNWNGGVLAPEGAGAASGVQTASWAVGSGDNTMSGINDTIINSRTQPTLVALPMGGTANGAPVAGGFGGLNGGIRVLNAGNVSITITGITLNGSTLTINCKSSSPYAPVASQLSLVGSNSVAGPFAPVTATFTGGNGVFQATTTVSGAAGFYQVICPPTAGTVVNVENSAVSLTQTLTNIDFANWYTCAAFDNVGNLYAASTSTNYWRAWSPPGANTNTTVAVATLTVQ